MEKRTDRLVDDILKSYDKYELTENINAENMLSKDILIDVLCEIRRLLFPGFFDKNKVRNEYIKFLVGEKLEFI